MADGIVHTFPNEVKSIYYTAAHNGIRARGKLYDQYNNYRSALASKGDIQRRKRTKRPIEAPQKISKFYYFIICVYLDLPTYLPTFVFRFVNILVVLDSTSEIEREENLSFLLTNIEPWSKVIEHWKSTFCHRQKKIQTNELSPVDIISKYSCFETNRCLELV